MTIKDFIKWTKIKVNLHNVKEAPFFYEREIWWVAIGHNIGWEEDGKGEEFSRPIVILRKFNKFLFWGVPLTTTKRRGKYYFNFEYKKGIESTAIVSQLRIFDAKRLSHRDGTIKEQDFNKLQRQISAIIIAQSPKK